MINLDYALWWAIGLGFILDNFSFSIFGIHIISLILFAIIANFLLVHFFTNRSLYSYLALISLSTIIYEIFITAAYYTISRLSGLNQFIFTAYFFTGKIYELILNLLITVVLFYLLNYMSKKLKPVFLLKPRF